MLIKKGAFGKLGLAKLPPEAETTSLATLLPREGLAADSVRLNAADAFGLEGFHNVYTGEYTLEDGTATAFLADRQTPAESKAEAKRYRDFLAANGYQEIHPPGGPPDMTVLSLDNSFEIIMVQGRMVAGVHDATSATTALELAVKLQNALKGKP